MSNFEARTMTRKLLPILLLLTSCGDDVVINPPPDDEPPPPVVEKQVTKFLWKPISESNGNLVVLINPGSTNIFAEGNLAGEKLVDHGPSNNFEVTARGTMPGCAYGNIVNVRFVDIESGIEIFPSFGKNITLDGCNRVELP